MINKIVKLPDRREPRASTDRDKIQELSEIVAGDITLLGVDLAPKPRRLLGALLKHDLVTLDIAFTAMYYDVHVDDRPDARSTVGVYTSHLRRFLDAHGIQIHTQRGDGRYIKREDKEKLRNILEGLKTATPLRQKAPGGVKAPERESFEVRYDRPIPTLSETNRKWPWEKLDRPGASIEVKTNRGNVWKSLQAFRKNPEYAKRRFSVRTTKDGCEVWRLEDEK